MTCYAERSAWPVKRDLIEMARVTRIYPRITGTPGDTVRFWIGVRTTQLASIQWYGPYNFTLGTDYKIDTRISGRLMDFRIEYSGTNTFRFSGMEYEFEKDGLR
jgi:hypothetical protein